MLATYIVRYNLRGNRYYQFKWARRFLYKVKMLGRALNIKEKVTNRKSSLEETKNFVLPKETMHGIPVPKSANQALELDKYFKNSKWSDAMKKEISMMFKYEVFEMQGKNIKNFQRDEGWQYAPLHWVFAVKHDHRHKARLVIGGHVTDAEDFDRYASTVRLEHVRLQIFLLALHKAEMIGGDIGSAYLNAYTKEKYGAYFIGNENIFNYRYLTKVDDKNKYVGKITFDTFRCFCHKTHTQLPP